MRKNFKKHVAFMLIVLLFLFFPSIIIEKKVFGSEFELLPEDFKKIPLGISIEEFKKLRPNIKKFDLRFEFDKPHKEENNGEVAFVEQNIGFYDFGWYSFRNGKLAFISIWKRVDVEFLKQNRQRFIEKAINQWGKKYSKWIVKERIGKDGKFEFPMVLWKMQNFHSAIVFSPTYNKKGEDFIKSGESAQLFLQHFIYDPSKINLLKIKNAKEATISDEFLFKDIEE